MDIIFENQDQAEIIFPIAQGITGPIGPQGTGVKIETWTAKAYASGDQVTYLGNDWTSNDVTVAGDVPGTSSKWVERLSVYSKVIDLNKETQKNNRKYIVDNSLIANSLDEEGQTISYRNVIEPIVNYTHQTSGAWSKTGFWSFMTAINDYYADEIGIHLYSLAALTGNLRVKIFINDVLDTDLTVLNADLVDSTIQQQIQTIPLNKRIAIKQGDVVAIGWEMSNSQTIQLVHNSLPVDNTKNFGLNQNIDNSADGSIISATVPPAVPASGDWYLPVHFTAKTVENKAEQEAKNKLLERLGGQVPFYDFRINSDTKNVWSYGVGLETVAKSVWLKGYENKIINAVCPIVVRGLSDDDGSGTLGTFFTNGVVVSVALNDKWIYEKEITLAELVAAGANSTKKYATPATAMRFVVEIPIIEFKVDDILYVNWACKNPADRLGFSFTEVKEKEWLICRNSHDTSSVNKKLPPPSAIINNDYQIIVDCCYLDFVAKKIQDGGYPKETLSNVYPTKIYTVCNDIDQSNNGFSAKNYAACLYLDHFLKISDKKDVNFKSTNSDKLPLFSQIATDNSTYNGGVNVKQTTVTDKIVGAAINDIDISINHISTKASLSSAQFPKVLVIGDSVTNGFLGNIPITETIDNPKAYAAFSKKFFELDKIANGSTGHKSLFIGKLVNHQFKINGNTIRCFGEGRGGWSATNFLYDTSNSGYDNYFYDSTKPTIKFSLAKYLANYKTLADDGETRLVVGSTAGTLVTDVNEYDVCTPTHVVIQLGFNDDEAAAIANIQLMIDVIKAEYPTMIVIISSIDSAGTYFPEKYPMFDASSVGLFGSGLHSKMYNLCNGFKAMENVGSKIFYCPNYFIQPTAWGVAFRDVAFPENMINGNFPFKTEHGAGCEYHPNNYAHAAWGYQLYSLIKYTLTL